jgi:polysaccharide export outer membrane protein
MKGAMVMTMTAGFLLAGGTMGLGGPGSAGAQTAAQPAPPPKPDTIAGNGAASSTEYKIGAEDVLQIFVWKNENLSRNVAVRPDGRISFPLLEDIQAAGMTPRELRDLLTKKLAEFVAAPEVSVIVTDVRSMKVSVIGEVPKPGRFELKSKTTVLDVLAMAGGFGQFASRAKIVILRPEGEAMKRIPFNYNKVVSPGGEQENIYLQAGDIVVVP